MKVDIYVIAPEQEPRKSERYVGYMIGARRHLKKPGGQQGKKNYKGRRSKTTATHKKVYGVIRLEATAHGAVLGAMVEALDRFTRPAEITFHITDGWIIGNLTEDGDRMRVIDMWQQSRWMTKRGTEVKNRKYWQALYNKMRVFTHSGGTFAFRKLEREDRNTRRLMRVIEREY